MSVRPSLVHTLAICVRLEFFSSRHLIHEIKLKKKGFSLVMCFSWYVSYTSCANIIGMNRLN